jgi:hypothetical protein
MRAVSKAKESQSELKERTATLNTLLRFGRERPALLHAYKLRAYLQLRGARLEPEQRELERVEKVIVELEKRKTSGIQKLIKSIIDTAKASLNPEVDDETTLLDHFKTPVAGDFDDDLPPEKDPDERQDLGEAPLGDQEDGHHLEPSLEPVRTQGEPSPQEPLNGWGGAAAASPDGQGHFDGWGGQSEALGWTAAKRKAPGVDANADQESKPKRREQPESGYWGGGEGYNYDDHL